MKLRAFSIDFRGEGGILLPTNPVVHKLAIDYCEKQLARQFNFTDVKKVIAICEIDDNDQPVVVHAISALVFKPVIPVFRATLPEAGEVMIERLRSYLEDQGWKGSEVLIHLDPQEPTEAKCPKWKKLLRLIKAEKTLHWSATV